MEDVADDVGDVPDWLAGAEPAETANVDSGQVSDNTFDWLGELSAESNVALDIDDDTLVMDFGANSGLDWLDNVSDNPETSEAGFPPSRE